MCLCVCVFVCESLCVCEGVSLYVCVFMWEMKREKLFSHENISLTFTHTDTHTR